MKVFTLVIFFGSCPLFYCDKSHQLSWEVNNMINNFDDYTDSDSNSDSDSEREDVHPNEVVSFDGCITRLLDLIKLDNIYTNEIPDEDYFLLSSEHCDYLLEEETNNTLVNNYLG